ncbi:MAG: zinc ribbon domain-containing protein [Anaerolineae bacterium]|nr:zinc ribbon domain-containing protein [Anaerolineae bacterium]
MGYCSFCGAENRSGGRFCKQCGKQLEETAPIGTSGRPCAYCGTLLRADASFCRQCGKPVAALPASVCLSCGQALRAGATFCAQCGTRIVGPTGGRVCPCCGAPVKPTARFCPACRAPLAAPAAQDAAETLCPNCGTVTRPGARFCHACSHPLVAAPSPPPPPLPPAQQPGRFGTGDLLPLVRLSERYLILEKIAQGGMGAVYRAQDLRLQGKIVAVKEMSESVIAPSERERVLESFQREAELLARLSHPNLVRVTDRFEDGERHYMVMEFIEGQTLKALLDQRSAPFPEEQVLIWAEQLCSVLAYLHAQNPQIIYRDVKPNNVMVVGETGQVKLIDFGIARFYKPGQRKDTIEFGTDGFAPPEQYGKSQTDERADVYALGAMLHQLLTLRDPNTKLFSFPPLRRLNPAVSRRVEAAIARAVEPVVASRHQSVREMWQALSGEALEEPAVAQPAPGWAAGGVLLSPSTVDFGSVVVGRAIPERLLQVSVPAGAQVKFGADVAWLRVQPERVGTSGQQVTVALDTRRLKAGRSRPRCGLLKRLVAWPLHLLVPAACQVQGSISVWDQGGQRMGEVPVRAVAVPSPSAVLWGRLLGLLIILGELGVVAALGLLVLAVLVW